MLRKIKILQAIRQGKVGGGETHVMDLVNELNKEEFESVILSFTDGPMVERLRADGFKVYVVQTEKPFNYKVWKLVKKIVEQEKINLIHAHGTRANSNTFSTAKSLDIPLIYTVHGWSFHPDQSLIVKIIRTLSERFLVKKADQTICVSESNLKEGLSRFPMANATVILNGINQQKFNPDQRFKDVKEELNIAADAILVGYIARITAQKEPLNFLRAIAQVPVHLNVKFMIVGDGELKAEMLELACSLNLNDRVVFQDFRSDIPEVLNALDIFCLPSLWEGLPIALLEAMAMRKAIVATEIDGIKDLIKAGENGLLIPISCPDKIAEAIILLIEDPELRRRLGEQAGLTIRDKFNVERMTRSVEEVYRKLVPLT
ncbi:Glycosyltransferase involved in cell wall bisynthesis [Pedobacter sp. ok626]|uniref:glycosyltransferase family 4 protein n=1 Tax=Pedobacter sp. ok626 TaxID=1761882 RepID=UPI000890E206|nr:glycosyltransferase family 4 protein [Pedobacter sp. ok626]SDJ57014.1 Glycosyltransferase involved in cell wall bisynthesis [Pedobacter sp. ok626]